MAANKSLSADNLFALMRSGFAQVPDQRAENAKISLPDALMSGFAMFSLKSVFPATRKCAPSWTVLSQ
jgi:hypothetical protein